MNVTNLDEPHVGCHNDLSRVYVNVTVGGEVV